MESNITGKKWEVRGNFRALEVYSKEYGVPICTLARQSSFESEVDSQAEANATLISKAPQMLDMIKELIHFFTDENNSSDEVLLLEDAKKLINLATEI